MTAGVRQLAVGTPQEAIPMPPFNSTGHPWATAAPGRGLSQWGDAVGTHISTAAEMSLVKPCLAARSVLTTPIS